MTLVDTSALIEYLRNTGSNSCNRVRELLLSDPREIGICEAVRFELLAGARDDRQVLFLESFLSQFSPLQIQPADYDSAATLYRRCRRGGETVRKLIDCLIAAVATRAGVAVLHNDRDFDVLARHTGLQVDRVAG